MIGAYSSIGICIKPESDGGWWVRAPFQDGGFCDAGSTEGEIALRYLCHDLAAGLDTIKADVESLWDSVGRHRHYSPIDPLFYMHQDGEDRMCDYPTDWRKVVAAQCARLGWFNAYSASEAAQ